MVGKDKNMMINRGMIAKLSNQFSLTIQIFYLGESLRLKITSLNYYKIITL